MTARFSERHDFQGAEPPITVREDAPEDARFAVGQIAVDSGLSVSDLRKVVCGVLYVVPNRNNWSEYPNVWNEAQGLLGSCPWFKVYDIAEAIAQNLTPYADRAERYRSELNRMLREKGIGWEMGVEGRIVFRGSEPFAAATTSAGEALAKAGRHKAASEIHEALRDISRRPTPDVTGAVQHSIAALECTARDVTGEPGATLGKLLPKLNLPPPLDTAITKLWGFASERARHIREGEEVSYAEAELLVTVSCAVCTFLSRRAEHD